MSIKNNFNKIVYYLRRYGFLSTLKKVLKRIFHIKENRKSNQEQYEIWMKNNALSNSVLEEQRNTNFNIEPKISIVIPMYNTNEIFFKELIESIENQTYSNWELCLADGSEKENKNLEKYYINNSKIKYNFLGENKGISGNTNEAIKISTGDYIGFMDHDDLLSQDALFEIVKKINEDSLLDFIYTDEDKIDQNGERFEPYFKPDFSPETLECNNYITHFVVVKKKLLLKIGMLDSSFDGAQDFDLLLRIAENTKNIAHISKILYHWRVHKDSTANVADAKPYAYESGKRVIEEHLRRIKREGQVDYGKDVPGIYKIKFKIENNPKVNILIPNRDNKELLRNCINSLLKNTTYKNYEIDIIENNSRKDETFSYYNELVKNDKIKVLSYNNKTITSKSGTEKLFDNNEYNKNEFNYSSLINFGVRNTKGEFILQLNNDTKLISR